MKQFILFLLFILLVNYTFAQNKARLKGPRYKNYKPQRVNKSNEKTVKTYALSKQQLKGPKAKNYKPKITRSTKHPYRVTIGQEQRRMGKHRKLNVGTTYRRSRK